jgi:AcrR family transcriptional regulator
MSIANLNVVLLNKHMFIKRFRMNKTDRRTSRTRRQLREALMALILKKGYDAVTIEDVTGYADLGRTTFYLHYKDKEELLLESIETITDELKSQIGLPDLNLPPEQTAGKKPLDPLTAIEMVFRHAGENATLYRVILNGGAAQKALSRLQDIISEAAQMFFQRRLQHQAAPVPQYPQGIILNYFSSSMLGLLNWWLEQNLPYSPEVMAEAFVSLFFRGANQALGLTSTEPAPPAIP